MIDTVQKLLRTRTNDESVAVISPERTWTWREYLADAAAEASALLARMDPARPMHVGALMTNSPAYLRAMAAAALGGYVLCGINTTRRGEGLVSDITRSDCQLLLVDDDHAGLIDGLDLAGVAVLNVAGPHYCEAVGRAKPLVPHEVAGTDPFMMIFTSGTSGNPKAVPFVHTMSVMCGLSLVAQMDITAEDVCYLAMPLFHSNGVAVGFSVAVTAGAAMVPVKFSVSRLLPDLRRYGVTFMNYVGKPLALVLATPSSPTTPTTRCASCTATRPPNAISPNSHGVSAAASSTDSAPASSPSLWCARTALRPARSAKAGVGCRSMIPIP